MRARTKKLVGLLVLLVVASGISWYMWGSTGSMNFTEERVTKGLGIKLPIRVDWLGIYLDGGTCGGAFRDAWNRRVEFAYRGEPEITSSGDFEPGALAVYIGADHWRDREAVRVPSGSIGELDLITALEGWVDAVLEPEIQKEWLQVAPPDTICFSNRKEMYAYHLLGFTKSLRTWREKLCQ